MKRIAFIIVTLSMVFVITYSALSKRFVSDKLLFKQTIYSQMTSDPYLSVEVFSNADSLYTELDAIEYLYIGSLDEHHKLMPKSVDIQKGGIYSYLGDDFQKYTYKLELPSLEIDYYIKDCYLNIWLKNGDRLQAQIGRLSLMKPSTNQDFSIVNQYGNNIDEGQFLNHITVDISSNRPILVESVCYTVNHCVELKQSVVSQQSLEIDIETDAFYYQTTALKIFYTVEGELFYQTMNTFKYFEHMTNIIPENSFNRIYVTN